jgi:hypothetical protein
MGLDEQVLLRPDKDMVVGEIFADDNSVGSSAVARSF